MPLGANDGAATLGTVWPLLCAAAIILALLAAGCGRQAGEPCVFQGSGFTASDPCATRCLSIARCRRLWRRCTRPQAACCSAPAFVAAIGAATSTSLTHL